MINSKLSNFIRNKLNILPLILFVIVMQILGFAINHFEHYPLFGILAPTLFIMMFSIVLTLKFILCKLDNLKKYYESIPVLNKSFQPLFQPTNAEFTFWAFLLIVGIYFICLYCLKYYDLNLMGIFILFLGGSTFFLALICYEQYVRLTICIKDLEKNMHTLELVYNFNNPKETVWLRDLYKLCRTTGNASLIIGLLFVFENAMIFWANASEKPLISNSTDSTEILKAIPLELWFIWIFIFISIALAFPLIAIIQSITLKKIVINMQNDFNQRIMKPYDERIDVTSPFRLYVLLKTIHIVDKSLTETYLLRSGDRFIAVAASLLTCLVHLLTFYEALF